ncbi:aminodeoxychorismate lyase [Cytobacillus sp. FJAT-54145]|uniref:Aminodeoxychorismate lyase n=1 Tax=Cytobacillus spartinae TaxID=3299023 RepID=A0ABW6KIP5_9BACI
MYIFLNGQVIKKEDAMISPFEHGFLYGLGLFETFRVYNGHPFLLDDHLARLNSGLEILNIKKQLTRDDVVSYLGDLLGKNGYDNAYIRLNVSAGNGEIGLQTAEYVEPNLIIFSKPLPEVVSMSEKKAKLLKLNRNTPEGDERLKSHHYLNNILAKREIGDDQSVEGIFLTREGFIAEGVVSNIFWTKGNTLYTPSIDTGILNGITRRFILKLGKKNGFEIKEGLFSTEGFDADEIFVTNSIQEIVPVIDFNGIKFPGNKGEVVQRLYHQYRHYSGSLWSRHQI